MNSLAGPLVLTAALAGLAGLVRALQKRFALNAELVRKLFHMGGGSICLALPWLLPDKRVFLGATLLIAVLLASLQRVRAFRAGVGGILGDVGRVSLGEVYFPLGVCAIYFLSRGDRVLYAVPLLILTFADAVAALIGTRYGSSTFETRGGEKSVEGSVAFFLAAFLSVHVPILLSERADRLESLLIAAIVGLLIMMLEAVSWSGLDNLFIPLISFVLLKGLLSLQEWELAARLIFTLGLSGLVFFSSRHSAFRADARLAAILLAYLIWMITDWRWIVMPTLVLVSFRRLTPSKEYERRYAQTVYAVLGSAAAGLVWVFCSRAFQIPRMFFPYTVTFAANLALIGIIRERFAHPLHSLSAVAASQLAKAAAVILIPFALIELWTGSAPGNILLEVIAALAAVAVASAVFCAIAHPDAARVPARRWTYQTLAAGLASCIAAIPFAAGWIGRSPW